MYICRCSFRKACLEREKDHVEGFAPEVAWVTHGGIEPLTGKTVCQTDFRDTVL